MRNIDQLSLFVYRAIRVIKRAAFTVLLFGTLFLREWEEKTPFVAVGVVVVALMSELIYHMLIEGVKRDIKENDYFE